MLKILNDAGSCRKLKVELAITVDGMMPFVQATYNLEGDGLLALTAYKEISTLLHFVDSVHKPNVRAVARHESSGNIAHEQQLLRAEACVSPAFKYFNSKFEPSTGELRDTLLAFKASQFFAPSQLNELRPSPSHIDGLKAFSFLSNQLIAQRKSELPMYLSLAEHVSPYVTVTSRWKNHAKEIPSWGAACKLMLLVQPSSAAAESIFNAEKQLFKTANAIP